MNTELMRALRDLDDLPAVRKRLTLLANATSADLRRNGLDAAAKFVRRVTRALGPWAANWWLAELSYLVALKDEDGEDVARFLRWTYGRPASVILTKQAAKRPDPQKLEHAEALELILTLKPETVGTLTKAMNDDVFDELVTLQVVARWDEPEMEPLRRWLEPTRRAAAKAQMAKRS